MNKIPTAKEFLEHIAVDGDNNPTYTEKEFISGLIRFAQLHVEAALKTASENAMVKSVDYLGDSQTGVELRDSSDYTFFVDKESILNAYSKENIK